MDVGLIDLDGSVARQSNLRKRLRPRSVDMRRWGPGIRLACRFGRFERFSRELADALGPARVDKPEISFCGSGDFHHVTLALLRRISEPINLLVIDNHPDWVRGVPFLHCGTWLHHAARLPHVRRVFHVGGDTDFDNRYRWLAPWSFLRSGKITVFPAIRCFQRGGWRRIPHEPIRLDSAHPALPRRLDRLIEGHRGELSDRPLYASVDKDVLTRGEAVVNWDSGHLTLAEVAAVLRSFLSAANNRLAGMDVVGDWSPVVTRGWLRRGLHWLEHPRQDVATDEANRVNERTNLTLLNTVFAAADGEEIPSDEVVTPEARRLASGLV
jgi:hypothetical protein